MQLSRCLRSSLWVLDPGSDRLGDKERISTNSYQECSLLQAQTQALRHTQSPLRELSAQKRNVNIQRSIFMGAI